MVAPRDNDGVDDATTVLMQSLSAAAPYNHGDAAATAAENENDDANIEVTITTQEHFPSVRV